MMKLITQVLGIAVVLISVTHAGELKTAIMAGEICEKDDGYVQATPRHKDPKTAALVSRINAKRQGIYSEIAQNEDVPCKDVAAQSAKERRVKNPERFCK